VADDDSRRLTAAHAAKSADPGRLSEQTLPVVEVGRGDNRSLLDRIFEVSIILKGVDGALEMIGGLLLLLVSAKTWHGWAVAVTRQELSQDPHDYIANHLLHLTGHLAQTRVFGAIYLLSHGAVKIVLVVALLKRLWWAYPVSIAFLVAFIAYQLYRIAVAPTTGMIVLTIFDVFVTWLVWREYQIHRRTGLDPAPAGGS
jgi:uncharacterized membrane protein